MPRVTGVPEPMYASIADAVPRGRRWTFEQKFDGMRAIAAVSARRVALVTRNGRDKRAQFPEIERALRLLAAATKRTFVLDGEIVALVRGRPAPFQALQGRFHRVHAAEIAALASEHPAAFCVFDLLRDGRRSLLRQPLHERRAALEALLDGRADSTIRISKSSSNGAR